MVSIKSMLPKRMSRKSSSAASSPEAQSPRLQQRDRKGKSVAIELPLSSSASQKIIPGTPIQTGVVIQVGDGGERARSSGSSSRRSEGRMWGGMEEVMEAFARFDANGDGKISAEEVRGLMRVLMGGGDEVVTEEEAKMMVSEADGDGDGLIDLQDFLRLCEDDPSSSSLSALPKEHHDELAAAFDIFDLDRNGCISAEELHTVMCRLMGDSATTLQDCHRIICCVDTKGSGHVDLNDFITMMTTTAA